MSWNKTKVHKKLHREKLERKTEHRRVCNILEALIIPIIFWIIGYDLIAYKMAWQFNPGLSWMQAGVVIYFTGVLWAIERSKK